MRIAECAFTNSFSFVNLPAFVREIGVLNFETLLTSQVNKRHHWLMNLSIKYMLLPGLFAFSQSYGSLCHRTDLLCACALQFTRQSRMDRSRSIMYLKVADNNRADTHLAFFSEAVNEHGFPLRIERLWRDVFMSVTGLYYNILHSLEDQDLLDISNILHMFCCHYIFLSRIQASLDVFRDAWDNHPIRTEENMTPNQLWHLGQALNPVSDPGANGIPTPEIEWEENGYMTEPHPGINVPVLDSPLTDHEMLELQDNIIRCNIQTLLGVDTYLHTVQYVENLLEAR
uniref:Integrase core domain-containing protein n=2 Tax=Nothobranchius kadleci TaxID=1051664 RepID=A0A1A8BYI3_NOTKA